MRMIFEFIGHPAVVLVHFHSHPQPDSGGGWLHPWYRTLEAWYPVVSYKLKSYMQEPANIQTHLTGATAPARSCGSPNLIVQDDGIRKLIRRLHSPIGSLDGISVGLADTTCWIGASSEVGQCKLGAFYF